MSAVALATAEPMGPWAQAQWHTQDEKPIKRTTAIIALKSDIGTWNLKQDLYDYYPNAGWESIVTGIPLRSAEYRWLREIDLTASLDAEGGGR